MDFISSSHDLKQTFEYVDKSVHNNNIYQDHQDSFGKQGSSSPHHFSPREENLFFRVWHIESQRRRRGFNIITNNKNENIHLSPSNDVSSIFDVAEVAGHESHTAFKPWERMFADYISKLSEHKARTSSRIPSRDSEVLHLVSQNEKATRGASIFSSVDWTNADNSKQHVSDDHQKNSPFPLSLLDIMKSHWDMPLASVSQMSEDDDEAADEAYRRLMRIAFTGFHNTSGANESPFLGDSPSIHSSRFATGSEKPSGMPRSQSDSTALDTQHSLTVLSKMPQIATSTGLCSFLDTVPTDAWMLPYVISGCSKDILSMLTSHDRSESRVMSTAQSMSAFPPQSEPAATIRPYSLASAAASNFRGHGLVKTSLSEKAQRPCMGHGDGGNNDFFFDSLSSGSPTSEHSSSVPNASPLHSPRTHAQRRRSSGAESTAPWTDLGRLYLSSDPSWCPWQLRRLLLLDNYLLELSEDESDISGFAQLNYAEVSGTALRPKRTGLDDYSPSPGSSFGSVTDLAAERLQPHILAVRVSHLRCSAIDGPREKFWIRCESFQDTLRLEKQLRQAAALTKREVYDWQDASDDSLLSKGRFTEVRVARRKKHCRSVECSPSPSGSISGSPARSNGFIDTHAGRQSNRLPHTQSLGSKEFRNRSLTSAVPLLSLSSGRRDRGHGHGGDVALSVSPSYHRQSWNGAHEFISQSVPSQQYSGRSYTTAEDFDDDDRSSKCTAYGPEIALKMVSKEVFLSRVEKKQERPDSLVREVLAQTLVCRLGNALDIPEQVLPIVHIFGVFETVADFCIELELMDNEDLFDKLTQRVRISENETKAIVAQLVEGVAVCRMAGIAHRDVKMSNITVTRDSFLPNGKYNLKTGVVKLADFGMAGFADQSGLVRGRCGTIGYVAPEILAAGVQEGYFNNVDMFSVGVVTYTLLCGYEPFFGHDEAELKVANKQASFDFDSKEWRTVSQEAKEWIRRAMSASAKERFTPEEARTHPWLALVPPKASWSPSTNQLSDAPRLHQISTQHSHQCAIS